MSQQIEKMDCCCFFVHLLTGISELLTTVLDPMLKVYVKCNKEIRVTRLKIYVVENSAFTRFAKNLCEYRKQFCISWWELTNYYWIEGISSEEENWSDKMQNLEYYTEVSNRGLHKEKQNTPRVKSMSMCSECGIAIGGWKVLHEDEALYTNLKKNGTNIWMIN